MRTSLIGKGEPSSKELTAAARDSRGEPAPLDRALERVVAEIQDGLRHGYFDFSLTCEIVNQERRRMTLRAGKSYQFIVPKEDCTRTMHSLVDSCNGSDPHDA